MVSISHCLVSKVPSRILCCFCYLYKRRINDEMCSHYTNDRLEKHTRLEAATISKEAKECTERKIPVFFFTS